jgi:molecular chaperone DnaK (HSP70)
MEGKDYIVAIDFGSSRAGSVFAKKTSDEKKIDIKECNFKDTGASIKTLNEVILNDSNEIISYGFAVNKYIKDGKLKENEALYRRIKMNLYQNLSEIESVNSSRSIDLEELISIILEHLKKHSIKSILEKEGKKNKDNIDYDRESSKIRWVLTIPAIWDEKNKYIMMKAAEKAGIVDEKNKTLFFALEPEAASYYCLKEKDSSIKDDVFKKFAYGVAVYPI